MARRKIVRKKNIYAVDWYRGDNCYRTTTDCDWEAVKECRRTAKLLGETIRYEKTGVKESIYTIETHRGGSPFFMAR